MTHVYDVLRTKGPQFNSLDGNTRVADALAIMNSEGVNHVVVTREGEYAGIFVDKDYTRTVTLGGKDSRNLFISQVITNDLPIVDVDVSVESCYRIMNAYKTNCLPVFENFNFMGVITLNDVVDVVLAKPELV